MKLGVSDVFAEVESCSSVSVTTWYRFPFVLNAVLQGTELCLGCFNAMNVMSFNNTSNLFAHNLFF